MVCNSILHSNKNIPMPIEKEYDDLSFKTRKRIEEKPRKKKFRRIPKRR